MATTSEKVYSVGGVRMQRPFKIRRLGHFGFNVVKLPEAVHFYRDLLGFVTSDILDFRPRSEVLKDLPHTQGHFFHYGGDHHAFVLFPKEAMDAMARSRGREAPPGITINQMTWQVGTLREVVEGVHYFKERSVRIIRSGRDMPGSNWHTYVADPDGHTNELYYGIEQIGWAGRSKPTSMYYRRFDEEPELPQMSEFAEIEEAKAKGIDVDSGFRDHDVESMPAKYDVGGVLLPRPFKITKIGPINIFVNDVETSERFYIREMGFTFTEDADYDGHRVAFLRAGAEHHSLGLFPMALRGKLGISDHSTNMSFGLELANYEQLRAAVDFLKANGCTFIDIPQELHPGIDYAAYVVDPDGHVIQLYYYMEQLGWQGVPRPKEQRRRVNGAWPETLEPLSDTYLDQVYQGPLG